MAKAKPQQQKRSARKPQTGEADGPAGTAPEAPGEAPPESFEAALDRLEAVVDTLEGGELELEVALARFEEGVRLTRHCAEQLDAAERRIEILMKEGGEWVERPFLSEAGMAASEAAVEDESQGERDAPELGWED